MKKSILILLTVIISCSKENKQKMDGFESYFNTVKTINLVSKKINLIHGSDTQFIQMPEMTFVDSLLIVNDINPSYTMKIVDLKTNKVTGFGKKGRGPNEYQSPFTKLSIDRNLNLLYASDFPNYRIYNIDSLRNSNTNPVSKIKIKSDSLRFFMSVFCNGFIVGNTFKDRFNLYNISTKEIGKQKFSYGKAGAMGTQGNFFTHPTKPKLVNIEFVSEVLSILTLDNNELRLKELAWLKDEKIRQVTKNGKSFAEQTSDTRNSFVSAATSEDYIYVLYSGKELGNSIESVARSNFSNMIYVFDWEGMPIKKYKLNQKVKSIAIDEKSNTLYAATQEDDEANLIKFDLN